ncbi:NAD+ synthase [Oleidesulfovibrio sp.]|uniref:NAD+ synthase n=1 Tax=Oleidesulfovibrio sp. TaxID=2909707 RepID=UPI003A86CE38
MRIALLQLNSVVGDIAGNAKAIAEAVMDASGSGAELCVTPELAVCGYPPRDLLLMEDFVEACWSRLEALAQALKPCCPVLVGAPVVVPGDCSGTVRNGAVLLEDGKACVVGTKVLLPTYDVFDERRYFSPSEECGHIVVGDKRIGVTICEDIWNDKDYWGDSRRYAEDPVAALIAGGVDIIVNLSASPFTLGKQVKREAMLGAVAARAGAPVVYVNQVGGNDDLIFAGKSMVLNAQGKLAARAAGFAEQILIADVFAADGSIAPDAPEPEAQIWQALVLGTRDYAAKCGFRGAILGLSGGIDSALVACIAAEALGPENVLGVLMPSPYSSRGSVEDSEQLVRNLGIASYTVPIEQLMQQFDAALAEPFSGYVQDVTEENIQSRIRGNLVMAMSNKFGKVLLTTGNKSELAVGYCTIYGDMAGGLGVIADLPKTMVYAVCRWLNAREGRDVVPVEILEKAPSAELRPDQKDVDSLPEYDVLDDILERHIVGKQGVDSIVASGHERTTVERIIGLVRRAEFKRRQAPPGLKVTDRAFGSGWRMPVAARFSL